jgi:hypothetical protein
MEKFFLQNLKSTAARRKSQLYPGDPGTFTAFATAPNTE